MGTLWMTASDLHTKYHRPPARSSDLLCDLEHGPSDGLRKCNCNERLFGIEIVFARFVNDAQLPELLSASIRKGHIDLAPLKGHLVAGIVEANDELSCNFGHGVTCL